MTSLACFTGTATNNVGNLFNMAGQVGKVMGTLVNVMTDDEGSGDDDDERLRRIP